MTLYDEWLNFANEDIEAGNIMFRESKYNLACFFAQQATEKTLKGFLLYNQINPPRIHGLVGLRDC